MMLGAKKCITIAQGKRGCQSSLRCRVYPTRVACRFERKDGHVALDQLGTVDKTRLVKPLGALDAATQKAILAVLAELFAA
jgi:mRNA-degrading endonuclease toxin of MazEF toxin-antitoxin module